MKMAVRKETQKVKDFAETVKEVTGQVKENYLNGLEFTLSLWEENLKVLNAQVDQWLDLQQELIGAGREFYDRFPKEISPFSNGNSKTINGQINRLVAFQKDYVESVRKASDKLTKETLNLAEKNIEKAFSLVDDYISLFKV
jgi:gas vesicle protein